MGGTGGNRIITGTLDNQATIDATADYLDITGTYNADGGTILGSGYLVQLHAAGDRLARRPPRRSCVTGQDVTLATDNLVGYTLWVQGGNHGGDAILQLAANEANRGTILLQSADSNYQSDIATGS